MEKEYKYMVCTSCMTYNHAPYIVDAMNGFTMQETTFPVYYLITDDASTDGEPEVIKQYLAEHFQSPYRTEDTDDYYLICAVHKTNPNCNFIVFFLKYNHYSIKKSKLPYQAEWRDNAKYIALCEGDDYWIHPGKLQMQVSFLEQHDDYSMCFHNAKMVVETGIEVNKSILDLLFEERNYEAPELLQHRPPTASLIFRSDVLFPKDERFLFGDNIVFLTCATVGKVKCLKDIMSVYRRHAGGVTIAVRHPFVKRAENRIALMEHFPTCKQIIEQRMARDMTSSLLHLNLKESGDVLRYIISHPTSIMYIFMGCKRLISIKL